MNDAARPGRTEADAVARTRVASLLERLTRIDLQVVVVALPDATRLAARNRAQDAAIVAGRGDLLDEAMAAAREVALQGFSRAGFSGTWALTEMAASVATSRDRVAAAAGFEEAAMAAVTEDLVDADTVEVLRATSNELGRLTGVVPPGSLAAVGSPGVAIGGPLKLALVGAFVIILLAGGLAGGAIATLALAVALIAALMRRRRQHGP